MKARWLLLGLLPLALPCAAAAQHASPVTTAGAETRTFGAALMAGSTTYADPLHGVVGVRLSAQRAGWGALGLAGLGSGGYSSRLVAGAATRRLLGGDGWSLAVAAGGGHYAEEGPSGIERSAPGLLIGLDARKRLGSVSVYLLATNFRGRYDGDDVVEGFAFDVPRIQVGVGY